MMNTAPIVEKFDDNPNNNQIINKKHWTANMVFKKKRGKNVMGISDEV